MLATAVLAATITVAVAPASASTPPFTSVGGLNLDAYCQHLGFTNSQVDGPITGPNAAFEWYCTTGTSQAPINLQAACTYEYPGAGSVAYAQDLNDSYSWICVVAKTGSSSSGGTKIDAVNKGKAGSALVVVTSGGESVFATGPAGSVTYEGSTGATSYLTYDGSGGGSVLTYNGSGGGSSVLAYNGSGGGSVLTFNGSNGGSVLTDQPASGSGFTAVVTYGTNGSLTMLTYDGSSGGSVLTYGGSSGGSVLTYEGSGGGSSV
ncbi:MAG TPA: hypothetical protein VKY26_06005 [Actinomycetota bacterium]|nr:hypothetical protein [Actinomycetota bacterium]